MGDPNHLSPPSRKIVLAGATGFIGEALRERYQQHGYEILMISRRSGHISWDDRVTVVIRTETELILKSRWVAPERLLREGFEFHYPTLREAMKEIAR